MIDPEIKRVLKEMTTNQYGRALRKYLKVKLKTLKGDIDTAEDWTDVLARRKAKSIILDIMKIVTPQEPNIKEKNPFV